jgi:hypothetical protein
LLQAITGGAILYYQAPLDPLPQRVEICRRFKNGKVRVRARDVEFTADAGHLDRFFWLAMP